MEPDEVIATLKEARDNIVLRIKEITAVPKPDYEIDGQKVSWAKYLDTLMKNLKAIEEQISVSEGPVEEYSVFYL